MHILLAIIEVPTSKFKSIHYQALKKMLRKFTPKQYTTTILFALFHICSSLYTLDETKKITSAQTLVSSGSVFELGFFKPRMSTNWFVGIWYVVSPEIVVWVANRDHPLNDSSSTLGISKGAIVLVDPWQKIAWSSSVNSSVANNVSNPVMQLLDSGNLVLRDPDGGAILWQSFDYPSNTLLPGMKIGKNLVKGFEWFLSSWKSGTDPSKGNYYYKMDTLGVPQNVLYNGAQIYFRTGPWNGKRFSGVPEMETYENLFSFEVVSNVNEVYFSFEAKLGAPLSRLVLNETGTVRRMVWDETGRTWSEFWYGPKDPCDYYGKCGPFGICNINEVTICGGLRGFYPKSQEEWSMRNYSGGYERKTQLSCHDNDKGFYLVKGVKLPDTHEATIDAVISIEECRDRCLRNCSCLAYSVLDIRNSSGCITWNNDLFDIRYIPGAQNINIKTTKTDLAQVGNNRRKVVLISTTVAATIVLLLITLPMGIIYWRKLRANKSAEGQSGSRKDTELPLFHLATVAASTNNFDAENKLGEGAFGIVYKGQLPSGDEIAVKRLKQYALQGLNEFMNEVIIIARLQHPNLVKLLGCCIQGSERIIIYEYMTNKSLDSFIFDKQRSTLLNWRSRWEVIMGIAQGLLYLHEGSGLNIIHRDLKAANILLDGEMTPKISDFGTARLLEKNEISTEIVIGTRGYMSPEYVMEGIFSVKSDIYSFGVMLLEVISGKRNIGNENLLPSAWKLCEEGKAIDLRDEAIKTDSTCDQSELERGVQVGLLCVQVCPNQRPTMSGVVQMLNGIKKIPKPSKPVVVCARITSE